MNRAAVTALDSLMFRSLQRKHFCCATHAASRELVEETGIKANLEIGSPMLSERYVVKHSDNERLEKSVHYFRARLLNQASCCCCCCCESSLFGEREEETKELKWMTLEDVDNVSWKSSTVKSVVLMALNSNN